MTKMSVAVPGAQNFFTGKIQSTPTIREKFLYIKPKTFYIMKIEVTGEPEIHIDLMSPHGGYDYAEQEMVIPAGPKHGEYRLFFNSENAPSTPVLFRIFFADSRPVSIYSINLLMIPNWCSMVSNGLLGLMAIAGLIFIFCGLSDMHVRIGFLIFIIGIFMSYHLPVNPLQGDNQNYCMVAQSLLSDSDIFLNEFSTRLEHNNFYGIVNENGKLYNLFPLGPSIVLAPLYALIRINGDIPPENAEILSGKIATAVCFGSALMLFFFLVSHFEDVGRSKALLLTFIFGFCSHQFSQHLGMFWSHNAVMPFILTALLLLKMERREFVFFAGTVVVFGYMMRPTVALFVPITMVWLWLYRRQDVGFFVAGCSIAGILVASVNLSFYGHIISPYSQISRLRLSFPSFINALIGNLFSPNRGLFVFMPWALFSMYGIWLSIRTRIDPFYRLIAIIFLLHLIIVSSFPHWWGGWSYGPRLLVETMPLLVLLLLPFLSSQIWRRRSVKLFFITALVFSLFVQIGGLTESAAEWNGTPINVDKNSSRIWNWSDMQFMRPLKVLIISQWH